MGTLLYMAPEQAQGQVYGKRVDMWSAGIILYLMVTGEHPYMREGDDESSFIQRIASQELAPVAPLEGIVSSLFQHLCSRSLSERYQASQAIRHPWITRNEADSVPHTQGEEMR